MSAPTGYHVAIILDGNGRWATAQGQPRLFGHAAGVKNLTKLALACPDAGVRTLTVYAFAIKNWKRDKTEVDGLWELFFKMVEEEFKTLMENGFRIKLIGNRPGLPANVLESIERIEEQSKDNDRLLLQIALNYDGVEEVARMTKRAIEAGVSATDITQEYVETHLDTDPERPLDIMIRTGAKKHEGKFSLFRNSSFLALQFSQAIGVSTETLWPAFTPEELKEIISYADPDSRLFGGQRE